MKRRQELLGPTYCLFYEKPLYIVKGEGIWLYDSEGKRYLDCYNNVASVGHCHPRVVNVLHTQAATLNTHTRYLHEHIIDYSEQLVKTMDGKGDLSVCLFTCTGSESNDLALRIARAYTGNEGFMITENAYHGSTFLTRQITPSIETGNEKGYSEFKPSQFQEDFVVRIKAPDVYQRRRDIKAKKDPNPSQSDLDFFLQSVDESIAKFTKKGKKLAAVIIDPCFMSDGILDPPEGYLQGVLDRVHAAGGIYIADEVQAGMGRTGTHLWGFQHFGIVPDIVTMGKPMGNGHPLGVVMTTPKIAAAFAKVEQYFNTFGGNPVSCAVGITVLEVIQTEKLIENSGEVGRYLRERLRKLQHKHRSIASIRGKGLSLGIEIEDPHTGLPSGVLAQKLVNRLKEDGILLSETGAHNNVLKFRPPMVISKSNADLFINVFDKVLSDLVTAPSKL
jgi:4-aminobutyrate aminotransferase-like enzyme